MDPLSAGVAKVAADATNEAAKTTANLWSRVLGPAADEVGEYLRGRVQRRLQNAQKIGEAAARKGAADKPGEVNGRLAAKVIDDGSQFDGPLAAEYFGGLLAGSKSVGGRDDVAVTWAAALEAMSTPMIRLHFLLYREWASLLSGRTNLGLGVDAGRRAVRLDVDLVELLSVLIPNDPGKAGLTLSHAVTGLHRLGLIEQYGFGPQGANRDLKTSPYSNSFFATPTTPGFELYCWALGLGTMPPDAFPIVAVPFDPETPIPRLSSAVVTSLNSPERRDKQESPDSATA